MCCLLAGGLATCRTPRQRRGAWGLGRRGVTFCKHDVHVRLPSPTVQEPETWRYVRTLRLLWGAAIQNLFFWHTKFEEIFT